MQPGCDIAVKWCGAGFVIAVVVAMAVEDDVRKAQAQLMTAMFAGDRETCAGLLGSDCAIIRPTADHLVEVVLRDGWLDEIARTDTARATVTDTVISAHGDVAVSTVYYLEEPDAVQPRPRGVTDIWRKNSDGCWQLAERHTASVA